MHAAQPRAWYHKDDGVEMMRALCYGGLVVNKRPIFLAHHHVGNSNPLLSFSLCVWRKESGIHGSGSSPPPSTHTLSDRKEQLLCCSSVGGLWSLTFGKRLSPTVPYSGWPNIACPQHLSGCRAGPRQGAVTARPLVHSSALSQNVWVCLKLGSSPLPHPSLPKHPPTVCLLTWLGVVLGPGPRAPVCVWHLPLLTPWWCVIGGICVCLCLPGLLDAGGNRMWEDQL